MSSPDDPASYEPRPDPNTLKPSNPSGKGSNDDETPDYEPHPERSVSVSQDREMMVKAICNLYSGSSSEKDMQVYAKEAIYDDPWSYCDTRYKIAGQWYGRSLARPCVFHPASPLSSLQRASVDRCPIFAQGIPKVMAYSNTLATEIVSSTPNELVFKLKQEYTPRGLPVSRAVCSLVSLALDEQGKVKYHKDMWNEKDYSHGGLGKVFKTLNGDYLTKITKPPEEL